MVITRKSLHDGAGWIALSLLTLAGVAIAYPFALRHTGRPSGGSAYGLTAGALGTAMIAFAMALIVRKTWRTLRIGSSYAWLQGHVWLGLASYVIIWFHAGWRWGGPLTTWLMIAFTLVWLTGILGVAIQSLVPRVMSGALPDEAIYDQLAKRRQENLAAAERAMIPWAAQSSPEARALQTFYTADVRPFLTTGRSRPPNFDRLRGRFVPLADTLTELESRVREHEQYLRQRKLHWLLHGWLLVHVPLSVLMVVAIPLHAVIALRY